MKRNFLNSFVDERKVLTSRGTLNMGMFVLPGLKGMKIAIFFVQDICFESKRAD